jgi:hypothetical protein
VSESSTELCGSDYYSKEKMMSEEWRPPSAPDLTKDFNAAAKEQAKQIMPPSEKGIATKKELEGRTALENRLREKMQLQNAPALKPKNEIAKNEAKKAFEENKKAFEANQKVKDEIKEKLAKKKREDLTRQFNERTRDNRTR